jgi:hypothetical protein
MTAQRVDPLGAGYAGSRIADAIEYISAVRDARSIAGSAVAFDKLYRR